MDKVQIIALARKRRMQIHNFQRTIGLQDYSFHKSTDSTDNTLFLKYSRSYHIHLHHKLLTYSFKKKKKKKKNYNVCTFT